jgi:hypothetical protein
MLMCGGVHLDSSFGQEMGVYDRIFVVFLVPVILPHVRPRFLPCLFCSVKYSLIILSFRPLQFAIISPVKSPFYLATTVYHLPPLLRGACWRSFEWATLIRTKSRQEVVTDGCQIK